EPPDDVYRDHVGIHPQKQAGYVYAGMSVLRGRLTVDQMRAAGLVARDTSPGRPPHGIDA
ncbi:MAG: Dissimilatory sulfite reductase, partial [Candidatus Rokubacteria bacterium]|nr:Dissimilatory sulfite reductase [Candidatus Rokubacteria bacterium]